MNSQWFSEGRQKERARSRVWQKTIKETWLPAPIIGLFVKTNNIHGPSNILHLTTDDESQNPAVSLYLFSWYSYAHTHTISSKIYLLFVTSSSDTTSFTSTFDLSRAFDTQLWKKRERKLPEVQFQVTVKAKKVSHSSCLASRFHPDSAKREVWGRDLFIPWLLLMGYSWESYSSWAVDLQATHIAELPILCQPLRANDGASQQFLSWAELPIEKNANQKVSFYTAITGNFFTTKSGSFSAIIIQFPSVSSVVWSIYINLMAV